MTMSHRERVRAALEREVPDRCPFQSTFTPEFAARLRRELGLTVTPGETHRSMGGGDYELERATGQDLLLASVGWANAPDKVDGGVDEWGVRWRRAVYETPFGPGAYMEMAAHPLADAAAVASYRAPDPDRPELYEEAARTIGRFGPEYWIVGVAVTTIFETAWALRGLDALLTDFVTDPDLAEAVLDIPYRYHLAVARRLAAMGVDMVWTGDDVGGQSAMIISPAMWRRFLKPRLARFFAEVRAANPRVKIAYHSDGFIEPIITDLIEIGCDVLNPIQPACMDPEALKRRYGDRLSFWGTVDEQRTLPFGTPADVAAEVAGRIRTVGRGGGLIVGPTHHVQLDTPLENFRSMREAIERTPCA